MDFQFCYLSGQMNSRDDTHSMIALTQQCINASFLDAR